MKVSLTVQFSTSDIESIKEERDMQYNSHIRYINRWVATDIGTQKNGA